MWSSGAGSLGSPNFLPGKKKLPGKSDSNKAQKNFTWFLKFYTTHRKYVAELHSFSGFFKYNLVSASKANTQPSLRPCHRDFSSPKDEATRSFYWSFSQCKKLLHWKHPHGWNCWNAQMFLVNERNEPHESSSQKQFPPVRGFLAAPGETPMLCFIFVVAFQALERNCSLPWPSDGVISKQDYTDDMRYDMYRLISGHSTAVYLLYVFDVCQGHYPRTGKGNPWSIPLV